MYGGIRAPRYAQVELRANWHKYLSHQSRTRPALLIQNPGEEVDRAHPFAPKGVRFGRCRP